MYRKNPSAKEVKARMQQREKLAELAKLELEAKRQQAAHAKTATTQQLAGWNG